MAELLFEVTQESDGGYCAECLTLDIFTEGDTWEQLRSNVTEAVRAYFFDTNLLRMYDYILCETKCLRLSENTSRSKRT